MLFLSFRYDVDSKSPDLSKHVSFLLISDHRWTEIGQFLYPDEERISARITMIGTVTTIATILQYCQVHKWAVENRSNSFHEWSYLKVVAGECMLHAVDLMETWKPLARQHLNTNKLASVMRFCSGYAMSWFSLFFLFFILPICRFLHSLSFRALYCFIFCWSTFLYAVW